MSKIDPFQSSDLQLYCRYNESFKLPTCQKKAFCKCFRSVPLSFDFESPLTYIFKLMAALKKFRKKSLAHQNIILITNKNHFHQCTFKNFHDSLSYHLKTLKFFQDYFDLSEQKFLDLGAAKYLKFLKFVSSYPRFIDYTREKCTHEINEKKLDFVNSLYYDMSIISHYHTLKMFQKFVVRVSLLMK